MSAKRICLSRAFALLLGLAQAGLLCLAPAMLQAAPWPVKGKVVSYARVDDRLGSGHVVYTEQRINSGEVATRLIHAYRFAEEQGGEPLWTINDGVEECVDAAAKGRFSAGAPVITDLDGDGLLEIWTGYIVGCRSDVSPEDLKIIMYEGRKKYAMRGETLIDVDGSRMGGKGKMDGAFREAPEAFRRQAQKLWRQWRTGGAADGGAEPWPVKGVVAAIEPVSDSLGTGAVVYTRETEEGGGDLTMGIHAYRFNGEPGSAEKLWQINDGLEQCELPGDVADFMEDCPLATDLDGDGLKEFWTVYSFGCLPGPDGFARPDILKIIMYEGRTKHAMRGGVREASAGVYRGGSFKMDEALQQGPAVFRDYAEKLWRRWRLVRGASG
ncbi:MAG: hypothetical protein IKT16_01145 [Desulfovibrio sp.]|nr:hypothetical protein [Desulfovibrio sp.]